MFRIRSLSLLVVALAAALPALAVAKKGAGIAPSKLTLVQAQCDGTPGVPCAAAFAFKSGTATLTSTRQPAPTCPKTGDPTESKGGDVTLVGVTKNGAAFSGSLPAVVVLRTTFGSDPTGDCPLAAIPPITTESLTGQVACTNGRCKGTLHPIACLDPTCADVPVISEFVSLKVSDDAGNALAVPGTILVPVR
jgi:hypothetical protein